MSAGVHEPTAGPVRVFVDTDYLTGLARVVRSDGKYAEVALTAMPTSPIARSVHMMGRPYVVATTDRGEDITIEMPIVSDLAPLRGRPVVYLDQQAWSKLALARHEPELLPGTELDAARWLIDLVERWAVVLPYSNGVLTETTHWTDYERRRHLALTIAQLSRGWQMLDPLAVRAAEFRWVLSSDREAWPLPVVWTLEPGAASATRSAPYDPGANLPADAALTVSAAASTISAFATILDADPIPRADPNGWATRWADLANHVRETKKPTRLTALAVHAAVISDAGRELARAAMAVGLTPEALSTWLLGPTRREIRSRPEVRAMPAFGLAGEVTYLKIVNSTAKWEPNDLTDIFYLVHAAGYADAVVGERGFVELIRQAQRRLKRPATAHRTLASLRESGLLDETEGAPPTVE